eukprot:6213453-Pleurochrysis_carterae.AAC.13
MVYQGVCWSSASPCASMQSGLRREAAMRGRASCGKALFARVHCLMNAGARRTCRSCIRTGKLEDCECCGLAFASVDLCSIRRTHSPRHGLK